MTRNRIAPFALAACMLLLAPSMARATSGYRNAWLSAYPDACGTLVTKANNCSLCHTSVPALNAYGDDLAGTNGPAIELLDSDGDGYTNGQEIVVDCTDPSDAGDHGTVDDEVSVWGRIKALFR